VAYTVKVCPNCGFSFTPEKELVKGIRQLVEEYQRQSGLLTAEEVVARRKAIGFRSQEAFAEATDGVVSLATLKRLEAGQRVQDRSTDRVIRDLLESLEEKWLRSKVIDFARPEISLTIAENSSTSDFDDEPEAILC